MPPHNEKGTNIKKKCHICLPLTFLHNTASHESEFYKKKKNYRKELKLPRKLL
uniref:Uncharacterized protein n=1 Tax=Arundo donax TaxID=35708 RepID=A0A0A9H337_ARUDO